MLLDSLVNFYLLEEKLYPEPSQYLRLSHARWAWLRRIQTRILRATSRAVLGACYTACLGEARYGAEISLLVNDFPPVSHLPGLREEVYDQAEEWVDWIDFQDLIQIFDPDQYPWRTGYGGESWQMIARGGLKLQEALQAKKRNETVIWLDHLVDLEHNNFLWLDKFDSDRIESFQGFLDWKAAGAPLCEAPTLPEFWVADIGILRASCRALFRPVSRILNTAQMQAFKHLGEMLLEVKGGCSEKQKEEGTGSKGTGIGFEAKLKEKIESYILSEPARTDQT